MSKSADDDSDIDDDNDVNDCHDDDVNECHDDDDAAADLDIDEHERGMTGDSSSCCSNMDFFSLNSSHLTIPLGSMACSTNLSNSSYCLNLLSVTA